MKRAEIEYEVLEAIERMKRGERGEGEVVEFKREWIPEESAARRLAAHANSSRGEAIIWAIGVDEKNTQVVGAGPEPTGWWARVQKQFEGPAPHLIADYPFTSDDATIHALVFETSALPFLVKTERSRLEVPWREVAETRSARHEDLVLMLVPAARLPKVSVRTLIVHPGGNPNEPGTFAAYGRLLVVPTGREPVYAILDDCRMRISKDGMELFAARFNDLDPAPPPYGTARYPRPDVIEIASPLLLKFQTPTIRANLAGVTAAEIQVDLWIEPAGRLVSTSAHLTAGRGDGQLVDLATRASWDRSSSDVED